MLDLSKIDSIDGKLSALSNFIECVRVREDTEKKTAWAIHQVIEIWKGLGDPALQVRCEVLLHKHYDLIYKIHRRRMREFGLTLRSPNDPDFLIAAGAEVISDNGRQVILRLEEGGQPKTLYRPESDEDRVVHAAEVNKRREERRAERDAACQARRGDFGSKTNRKKKAMS